MRASEIRNQVLAALLLVAAVVGSLAWANGVHIPATWHLTVNGEPAVSGSRYRVVELTEVALKFNKPVEREAVESQFVSIVENSWVGAASRPTGLATFKWPDDLTCLAMVRIGPAEAVVSFAGVRDSAGVKVGSGPRVTLFHPDPTYVIRSYLGTAEQAARARVSSGTDLREEILAGPTPFCPETTLAWASPDGRSVVIREYVPLDIECAGPPSITLWVCDTVTGTLRNAGDWPFAQSTPVWKTDSTGFFIGPSLYDAAGNRLAHWNGQGLALAAAVAPDQRRVAIFTTVWATGQPARVDLVIWDALTGAQAAIRGAVKPTLCDGLVAAPSLFVWDASGSAVVVHDSAMILETTVHIETGLTSECTLQGPEQPAGVVTSLSPDGRKTATLTCLGPGEAWSCVISANGVSRYSEFVVASERLLWAPDSAKLLFVDDPAVYDLDGRRLWAGRQDPAAPPILRVIGWGPGSGSVLFMAEPADPAG
jgi:hypothetical protein